jgi:predicted DsbA family dithiol-disulfide isomerase
MKVEIWSDVVCPWCYIGKRRFERALAQFDGAAEVEVIWRSFQLNPDHPKGGRTAHDDYLSAKLGATLEQVRALNDRVIRLATAEGLDYDFDRYQVVNTFDAHRLTHFAKARHLGAEIQERLLRAQLVDGELLDDPETLVRLGVEVGLDADDTHRMLDSDAHAADVRDDLREARELGVNGVPFFVIDRRFGVSGAQETELFLQVLHHAVTQQGGVADPAR